MAQSSELTKRVITGVLGIAVVVAIIVYGGWPGICLLTTALSLGMVHEFSRMIYSLHDREEKRYLMLIAAWFGGLANLLLPDSQFPALIAFFLVFFGFYLFTAARHKEAEYQAHFQELMFSLFGLIYLVFLPLHLTWLRSLANGVQWTLVFFLMVWAMDSGAYFVGVKYGRRRIYPQISPKKSVEGGLGGVALTLLAALLYKLLVFRGMSWLAVVFIPPVIAVVSQIGDFCESFLKRACHVKDSGSILPGHGGVLDRFDGVVYSLPVMYACVKIFG